MEAGALKEMEVKEKELNLQLISDRCKKQMLFRKKARREMYLEWYKFVFLQCFPCIRKASMHFMMPIYSANKIMKSTLCFIMSQTKTDKLISIAKEKRLTDYKLMRKMIQFKETRKDYLDFRLILAERMNKHAFRCHVQFSVKLGKEDEYTGLVKYQASHFGNRSIKKSYVTLVKRIREYSL